MTSESNKKRQEYLEYNADIRAEYQWNGMIYLCSTYSFAPENWSPDKEETLYLLKKYPVGAETSCFVNPDSPQESVFVCKGEPISHVSRLMAGLMVLLCFSVIFIAGRRLLLGPTPLDDDDDNSGDSGDGGDGGE